MTGWNEAFPYAVSLREVNAVPANDPTWHTIYKWLDDTLAGKWEYFNGEFRFKTEQDKAWFLLRWSS